MWSEECGERSAVALAAEIAASARVEKRRFLENISVGCLLETQDMWCGVRGDGVVVAVGN